MEKRKIDPVVKKGIAAQKKNLEMLLRDTKKEYTSKVKLFEAKNQTLLKEMLDSQKNLIERLEGMVAMWP